MLKFTIYRLITALPTLFLLVLLTFFLLRLAPGGPFDSQVAWPPEMQAHLNARYGLDQPLLFQFLQWFRDLLHGDLKESFQYLGRPVIQIISELLPVSLTLGFFSIALSITLGILMGGLSAWDSKAWLKSLLSFLIAGSLSIPPFLTASLLILVFALQLGWFPPALWEEPASVVLPVLTLAIRPIAMIARLTQTSLNEALSSDYIRTARGKGLSNRIVIFKHALKNSLIPVLTLLGPITAQLLAGSFLVETLFQIPGLGKQFVQAILGRDYPLVMGITLVYGVLLLLSHLVVDLCYAWVDPRIRPESN